MCYTLPSTQIFKAIPVAGNGGYADQLVWSGNKSGNVTVNEVDKFLISKKMDNPAANLNWRYMWKLKFPQKIKTLLWLFCHNILCRNNWKLIHPGYSYSEYPLQFTSWLLQFCMTNTLVIFLQWISFIVWRKSSLYSSRRFLHLPKNHRLQQFSSQ